MRNYMKTNIIVLFICFMSVSSFAEPTRFYANPVLQNKTPAAFALSAKNQPWLALAHQQRQVDAERLFNALKAKPALFKQLKAWSTLSFEQRISLLPQVFEIECQTLGIIPPELIINTTLYPSRAVNFVFDIKNPGSGLVYLNPLKLKEMDDYAPLAFLLHETRHAYQFQLAFGQESVLAQGYKAAFTRQATLAGASFSDFLTLLNEYEAFQFGNHVLGLLTDWQFKSPLMGTFASQFEHKNTLKIDLTTLEKTAESATILKQYNQLAEAQYQIRYPSEN